jgi:methyl-accepting chemotaxis protein
MRMKIGARLSATFGAVLVLLLVICVTVSAQMSRMNAATQSIVNDHASQVALANRLKEGTYRVALLLYRALDERTPEAQQADLDELEAEITKNSALYTDLQSRLDTENGRAAFNHLIQARTSYSAAVLPVRAQLAAHDSNGARATLLSVVPLQAAALAALDNFGDVEQRQMDAAVQEGVSAYATARAVLWGLAAGALIIAVVLSAMLTRSIVRPLQRVVEGANDLAQGDLSRRIDVLRRDEVGAVAESLNRAIGQLVTIVGGVKHASEAISSATQQLAAGNTDLSQRTEEQAASLELTPQSWTVFG